MDSYYDYEHLRRSFEETLDELTHLLSIKRDDVKITVERPITHPPYLETVDLKEGLQEWLTNATFRIYHKNDEVTRFSLKDFPFCCGYLVSGFVVVHPNYRHYGIGSMMNKLRCRIAAATGHISLICTVVKGNKAQEKVLMKNGWSIITEGISPKTGNYIQMYAVNLNNFRDVEEIPNLVVQIVDPIYAELLGTLPEGG